MIPQEDKGGFPLMPSFQVLTRVKFTCVNKIEAMYEVLCVNVKVNRGSAFLFASDTSYIASKLRGNVCVST